MTYETETSLDQTASPSAKVVKKIWSRPCIAVSPLGKLRIVRRVAGSDCICVVSAPCA